MYIFLYIDLKIGRFVFVLHPFRCVCVFLLRSLNFIYAMHAYFLVSVSVQTHRVANFNSHICSVVVHCVEFVVGEKTTTPSSFERRSIACRPNFQGFDFDFRC